MMNVLIWLKTHKTAVLIVAAAIAVVALTLGLSLGLTLPVKSVTASGEVTLLTGENYTEGFELTVTTRAGKETIVPVTADMISGFDPTVAGLQDVTITYKKYQVGRQIRTIGNDELTLCVREDTLKGEYEPNEAFSTSGIFDLYYNNELFRTRAITASDAPEFTTRLSREYDIVLYYREGLGVPYHYTVIEVIDSIELEGVLYAPQGTALSKSNIVGDLRFHVTYKDGTEEYVNVYDDQVFVQGDVLADSEQDRQEELSFSYKGFEVKSAVTAYHGELMKPKSVTLQIDSNKLVYAEGETFDYASSSVDVVYERFGDKPIRLRATQKMILLADWQGDPNSENRYLVPITDGSEPIVFGEPRYYTLVAYYNSTYSDPVRVRIVSEEDAGRITGLDTTWRGGWSGPPKKGEELDLTDATLTVEYGFGYRYESVPMDDPSVTVTGYDKEVAGPQELTIKYEDFELALPVLVGDADSTEITRIIDIGGWNEPTRYSDDALVIPDSAYLIAEIAYGAQENANLYLKDLEDVEITGFTPQLLDPQVITIEYHGFTVTLDNFTIVDDRTKTLTYVTGPSSITINAGEDIDLDAYSCFLGYNTGEEDTEERTFAELIEDGGEIVWIVPYDKEAGAATCYFYIKYNKKKTSTITLYVEGEAQVEPELVLDVSAAIVTYKIGDTRDVIDIEHMKLYLTYGDNEGKEDITEYLTSASFEGFDTSTSGLHTATVRCIISGKGSFATAFDYMVE